MEKETFNYTSILNNFSGNMRNKRLELKMTQKELAQIVGVSAKTIQNYENKNTIPNSAVMEAIATALGLELDEIIDDNKETQRKLKIAHFIDYMESNPAYYSYLEELDIMGLIFNKVEFEKNLQENKLPDDKLDKILGGILDIPREEKIALIKLKLDSKITAELKSVEKNIFEKFDLFKSLYHGISVGDFGEILEDEEDDADSLIY